MSSLGCAAANRRARLFLATSLLLGCAAARGLELRAATEVAAADLPSEALIVDVLVNGLRRGEFTVRRDRSGAYTFSPADAQALGLPQRPLRASEVHFDERSLALRITLPADSLPGSTYDLTPRRTEKVIETSPPSGFVNYRLSVIEERSGEPLKYALANELVARRGEFLFRNESAVLRDGSIHVLRYGTQLIYDRRADQQRFILGDQAAGSGELGSTLPIGGIGLYKLYAMTPYLMRQPLAGFGGVASTPSQVEVRLGGMPVFREQVAPGPFEVKNLQNFAGARDVEVVVRDALGREQALGFPYYFADQALRAGLHEYAYSLGALREFTGERNADYGPGVLSAMHRYGVTDHVTIGVRGEAAPGVGNLGPTVLYRSDRLGAFSASLSASERDGRAGTAGALGHVYQAERFGVHAMARYFSDGYATVQDLVAPPTVRAELAAGGSVNDPRRGTVFLDRVVTEQRESTGMPRSTLTRLGYSYNFGLGASLFTTLARRQDVRTDTQLFIGLLLTLERATTLHLSAHSEGGVSGLGAQLSKAVPNGEGLGYRLGYDASPSIDSSQAAGFVQYNARAASVMLDASTVRSAGVPDRRVEAAVAGAVTYVGSRFGATRQLDDSFAAVQLASPVEGVRVYSNNQEIGRTDRDGRVIVPRVGSFYETQISIEERDVPLDYSLGELRRVIAPPYRSGSLVTFDVRRLRAVEGRIRGAENATVMLERAGVRQLFETGRDGVYYVEDLAAGEYDAHVDGLACRFKLVVPPSDRPIVSLPEVSCD
jgi:outer membrane usher protein